jgi:GDPmannose 4,6-dehydratase
MLAKNYPFVVPIRGDVTDISSINEAISQVEPDEVYNLAAISFVGYSWSHPHATTQVNGFGVLNLLEVIRQYNARNSKFIKFYQASSSEVFGKVQKVPQDETTAFWPRSPYGVSKAFAHHLTINYRESYNMFNISGILFNHESPIRGEEFVTRKISKGVARILVEKDFTRIKLGNLDAKRDWGFAGDYVEAMWLMMQQEKPADYVVATGKQFSVKDFLGTAFSYGGISDWERFVEIDKNLIRPAEVDSLVGDTTRIETTIGWTPKHSFEELVYMMVEADIARFQGKDYIIT